MLNPNSTETIRIGTDEILFRRLDTPVASWSMPGGRWAVEYWCEGMAYPVAQAWVFTGGYEPYVERLHVMEEHRHTSVGTDLLEAIKKRWPDLLFDAMSECEEQVISSR